MKYTMSMASSKEHLKQMILADAEMSDMGKLHDVFCVDKDELKSRFPQLYYAILGVLDKEKKSDASGYNNKEIPDLNIGDTIVIAGVTWRKFREDENGNSYMLADDVYKKSKFGDTNDWRDSFIRKNLVSLAERIKEEIGDKLVPIEVDLFSHDGLDDYGTCEDLVSILTYDLYHNNRKNIKLIDAWWWLATSNSTPSGYGSNGIRCVCSNGGVGYDWCDNCGVVRPFFILRNPKG